MLTLKQLTLRRGPRVLLNEVDLAIKPKQRVGLIGANGCGKSSLFALIRGAMSPDQGDFFIPNGTRIAHLAQETPALMQAALEYVIDGDTELRAIQQELSVAETEHDGFLIAKLHEQLDSIDGYNATARAGMLLHGLGFSTAEQQKNVAEFSGGWRMRLNLAQALMCRSDLLLLDEPTNHLDLDTVIWLENWLLKYSGTLIIISHDRDFLDNVCNGIAHIEQQKIYFYAGNYSFFEIARAEKLAQQQSLHEKQVRQQEHLQHFIDRFRAKASKAKQAQSRIKMLEKMPLIASAHVDSPFQFEFRPPKKLPSPLLRLENVAAGYADKTIFSNVNLVLAPGDRIGVIGPNGAGKSTFIKLLASELAAQTGLFEKNPALKIGYFAQHQLEQLDSDATPLEHLEKLAEYETTQQLRDYLGTFGFIGDQALTIIKNFSGGEKARLVLALIVWQKPNLLLLDEPTNHFDIEMREALTIALQEYQGALMVISHDRHLLRCTTDQLVLVYAGNVTDFAGDINDYSHWLFKAVKNDNTIESQEKNLNSRKESRKEAAQQRESIRQLQQQCQKLENECARLQKQLQQLETELAEPVLYDADNKNKLLQKMQQQAELKKQLALAEDAWLQAQAELEQFQT